jgi:hypothetical protein
LHRFVALSLRLGLLLDKTLDNPQVSEKLSTLISHLLVNVELGVIAAELSQLHQEVSQENLEPHLILAIRETARRHQ